MVLVFKVNDSFKSVMKKMNSRRRIPLTDGLENSVQLVDSIPLAPHILLQVRGKLLLVDPVHLLEFGFCIFPVALKGNIFILVFIFPFRFQLD